MRSIPLFWWSETRLMSKSRENYGDLLSMYIVEKLSGKPVKWIQPKKIPWYKLKKQNFLSAGSIIHHANTKSIVWGSGIIDNRQNIENADFRAVRGPRTRSYLLDLGYKCPEVYGDPAILLPICYDPPVSKNYKYGIVPHYHDFQSVSEYFINRDDIKVIDLMTMNIEEVTAQILECEKIISSSLHGLIVSHAYRIPAIWVKFSEKLFGNGVKFQDYFESVGIENIEPVFWDDSSHLEDLEAEFNSPNSLPGEGSIELIKKNLLDSCPFLTTTYFKHGKTK